MAKPIRNTPILSGRDAEIFNAEISQLPSAAERKSERARIAKSVEKLRAMIAALPR
ncbi:MAG: hypothetical protein NC098_00320 [Lachnoclostridium sp.]|nr:hypothetical protein [Lachnoclostridium sp.]